MAYDRHDPRDDMRGERSRWREDESRRGSGWGRDEEMHRGRGRDDDRGFFERAGDEISSWFRDDDDDRGGRRQSSGWRERWEHDDRHGQSGHEGGGRFFGGGDRGRDERGSGYRPMTGDYGRSRHESDEFFAASGVGRGQRSFGGYDRDDDRDDRGDRSRTPWGRDEYRRTSFAGSQKSDRDFDPHYHSWRERHLSELDRDYDEYRRENQSRFESEFATWRERRQQKRGLLGQIREQMQVVGNDEQPVGTVERVAGDRIILTGPDAEGGSGGHFSLSCTDIDRVEGDRLVLDWSADKARERWRDESRSRALFEREDQGEAGPGILNRSFEGTYR